MPTYIPDVKPAKQNEQTPWTVKVTVLEKTAPVIGNAGKSDYQRVYLGDEKGNQVQCTIYGKDIKHWRQTLIPRCQYNISNAVVQLLEQRFRFVNTETQWILNSRTLIESCGDNNSIPDERPKFIPFCQMTEYIETRLPIDVIAVVAQIKPPREVSTDRGTSSVQELLIIDEEFRPVMLSIWNELVEKYGVPITDALKVGFPVLMAQGIKAVSYKGFSLATRKESVLTLKPTNSRAAELKKWAAASAALIPLAISDEAISKKALDLPRIKVSSFVTIAELEHFPLKATPWVIATITVTNDLQRYYFSVCNKCGLSVAAECGRPYVCSSCHEQAIAIPRAKYETVLTDASGAVTAQVFADLAERHFQKTAKEIHDEREKFGYFDLDAHPQFSSTVSYMVQVKISDFPMKGDRVRRYTINNIQTVNDPDPSPKLQPHQVGSSSGCEEPSSSGDLPADESPQKTPPPNIIITEPPPAPKANRILPMPPISRQLVDIAPLVTHKPDQQVNPKLRARKQLHFKDGQEPKIEVPAKRNKGDRRAVGVLIKDADVGEADIGSEKREVVAKKEPLGKAIAADEKTVAGTNNDNV